MPGKYHKDFASFWYFYLSQHMKTGTRAFHYVGTVTAFTMLPLAITDQFVDLLGMGNLRWLLIPGGILLTYVLGFVSHWTIEKNQPATFVYPFYSVGGDLTMVWKMTTRATKKDVAEVRNRLATGWAVDRFGLYPPDYAKQHHIKSDRQIVPGATA